MRAATWESIGTMQVSDLPDPAVGPGDVLIEVGACGICGSDVHSFAEGAWIAPGARMGHEFAGTVHAAGDAVDGVAVGDSVAVIGLVPCGECPRCAEGRTNLCAAPVGAVGGYGEQVVVPRAVVGEQLFLLPPGMTEEEGALLEPFSVAARAVRVADVPLDEPILVLGLGAIGLGVLQVLKAHGATDVIGVDIAAQRLELAKRLGADLVLDGSLGDISQQLLELRGTTASPFQQAGALGAVFECSGAAPVFADALKAVRAAGVVVLVALTSAPVEVAVNDIVQKEIRVQGSFAYTAADCQHAFELMCSGQLQARPLISATYPLEEVQQAFQDQQDTLGSIKVLVLPRHS